MENEVAMMDFRSSARKKGLLMWITKCIALDCIGFFFFTDLISVLTTIYNIIEYTLVNIFWNDYVCTLLAFEYTIPC